MDRSARTGLAQVGLVLIQVTQVRMGRVRATIGGSST